ncbi:MAG: hypothetical protein JO180_02175 [Gemmatirosa sp.]|nr:hypothetical protein [Gemmatirosa sp.]
MTARVIRLAIASAVAFGVGFATLALPRAARAQDARLAAIADADARAAVGAVIVDAERQGLPREPLVTKALEGVEKGATGPRIEAAVRAMATRLAAARVALAPAATPVELLAGADALSAGVPAAAIHEVRAASPGRSTAVALGVLAQLSARGVPAGRAAAKVTDLVRRGANQAQMLALQRAIQDDLAVGVPPADALELRTRAIIAALPPPAPPAPVASLTAKP